MRRLPTVLALLLVVVPDAGAVARGHAVVPGKAPWFATVTGPDGSVRCSGVVVAPDRVATAAHCLVDAVPGQVRVAVGDIPFASARADDPLVAVAGIARHPRYAARFAPGVRDRSLVRAALHHDVAIVLLAAPVTAAPLPIAAAAPAAGAPAAVFGRGVTLRRPRHVVRTVEHEVRDDATCRRAFGTRWEPASTLCSDAPGSAYGSVCGGDSGGPLVAGGRLIGITSWGNETDGRSCGRGTRPEAFADAVALRAFLTDPTPVIAPIPPAARPAVRTAGRDRVRCVVPPAAGGPSRVSVRWERFAPRPADRARRSPLLTARGTIARLRPGVAGRVVCVATYANSGGRHIRRSLPASVG